MGSWFSNFHIRKRADLSLKQVLESISGIMKADGYETVVSSEGADCGVAVLHSESSAWFSVHSDSFSFEDPGAFAKLGKPLGKLLHTDILGISCMDSDFLYLNLLNEDEKTDAWMHIGLAAEMGIRRRTNFTVWKKKVEDYPTFRERAGQDYVFAEEFLHEVAHCLKLPPEHSNLRYSELGELTQGEPISYLYFKLLEQEQTELPKLQIFHYSLMPCKMEKEEVVSCINTGGKSRGLSVYFIGDYVEHEEITFEDVRWQEQRKEGWELRSITLEKVQLSNGSWAYRGHDPNFFIPPRVNPGLSMKKRMDMELDRAIHVRFTPKGNERKRLDIAVVFVPDENPAGQAGWLVWEGHESKRAFLQNFNKRWEKLAPREMIPEDSVDVL